jgi:hypothetical protein
VRRCTATILRRDDCAPAFDLILYDVAARELMLVVVANSDEDASALMLAGERGERRPVGSEFIRVALRRRGLDPDDYVSSPFLVREGGR